MYALIQNGAVSKYPYSVADLKRENPNTSFPQSLTNSDLEAFGVFVVYNTTMPQVTALQVAEEKTPVFNNNRWEQQWSVRNKTSEELDSYKQALIAEVTARTQQRLDSFAQTRGYDGILSACTYVSSTAQKFQVEGQYCVESRDATWAKLYEIMAEVEAGTRPMPNSYADIEGDLPALVWPV